MANDSSTDIISGRKIPSNRSMGPDRAKYEANRRDDYGTWNSLSRAGVRTGAEERRERQRQRLYGRGKKSRSSGR